MRAVYLTGPNVSLRAMVAADAAHAAAWFAGPFPITAERAETWLKEENQDPWAPNRHLIIACGADDAVVGGVRLSTDGRRGALFFHMAPWRADADALRAEALGILDGWMRDDLELMTAVVHIAADETETIAAAARLGMVEGARLREHIARPGHRVDLLIYQARYVPWAFSPAP